MLTKKKIELAHRLHKRLWNWLTENPDQEKASWPEWMANGGRIQYRRNYCFACELVGEHAGSEWCGRVCMFKWPGKNCMHHKEYDELGLYYKWAGMKTGINPPEEERIVLARWIANLPLKDVEKIIEENRR